MKFKRIGKCNQCGECCKIPISEWFMTVYDPTQGPRISGCQFLKLGVGGKYVCELTKGILHGAFKIKVGNSVKRHPKTRRLQEVTAEVFNYWMKECRAFPNPEDQAHCPPIYNLPKSCGYQMVSVD